MNLFLRKTDTGLLYMLTSMKVKKLTSKISVFDTINFKKTKKIFEIETKSYRGRVYIPEDIYYLQQKIYSSTFSILWILKLKVLMKKGILNSFFLRWWEKKNWISSALLYQFPNNLKISTGIGNDNLFNNSEKLSLESSASSSFVSDPFMMYDKWFYSILRYKVPYLFSSFYSFNSNVGFNIESNPFYLKGISFWMLV